MRYYLRVEGELGAMPWQEIDEAGFAEMVLAGAELQLVKGNTHYWQVFGKLTPEREPCTFIYRDWETHATPKRR